MLFLDKIETKPRLPLPVGRSLQKNEMPLNFEVANPSYLFEIVKIRI